MSVLTDYQWELRDQVWGTDTKIPVGSVSGVGVGPKRGNAIFDNPVSDGVIFGRELRNAPPIVFEASIVAPDYPALAFDLSEKMTEIFWGDDEVRATSRAVEMLRCRRPGAETRVVFGRPDRYDPNLDRAAIGFIPFTASFQPAHPGFFSDYLGMLSIGTGTAISTGGLLSVEGGLLSPLTTIAGARRNTFVTNAGTANAWPTVVVTGPITNPMIALVSDDGDQLWVIEYVGTVPDGQTLTLKTAPWERGAFLGDGSSIAGALSRRTRLIESFIPPGDWEVIVGGIDPTGTADFTVTWRDGYKSI